MPGVVVDTDVVSYIFRRDSRAALYRDHLEGQLLIASFMTVAELNRWALQYGWGLRRRARLEEHLADFLIHESHPELCLRWAEVMIEARRKGRPIGTGDAWIAATAPLRDIPLVTHNAREYTSVDGLTVISEAAP
jgi:tRNA(fMet)-specific endonuclease VapC